MNNIAKFKERYFSIFQEGFWILLGQILSIIGTLILVRVLTENLSPDKYGKLSLGLTISSIVNQLIIAGIVNGISRFYSVANIKNDLKSYLTDSKKILLYATCFILLIAFLILTILYTIGQTIWIWILLPSFILSIISGYINALGGIQNASRQRKIVALHSVMDAWLKIGITFGLIFLFGSKPEVVIWGYVISSFIVLISQFYFLNKIIKIINPNLNNVKSNWLKEIWHFSWPFNTWGIFSSAQQMSDRWALNAFTSNAVVGEYAVVFQLGYAPINLASGLIMSLIEPILYQKIGDNNDKTKKQYVNNIIWKIATTILTITFIASLFGFIFHELIFRILVAKSYSNLSYLLPWVFMAGGFFATGQMLSIKLLASIQSKKMVTIKVTTSILGVLFNVLGAYFYGIKGVIFGLLLFGITYSIWMVLITYKIQKNNKN